MFDPALVEAGHPYWRNPKNDMAVMLAGFEAFLNAPWGWPPTLFEGPLGQPVSIVFTDSIPWLALLLKALGQGEQLNLLGLFLLLNHPLQALGMVCVLRSLDVTRAAPLLFGAALALTFPPWLARELGHIGLSGHWILLFALATALSATRFGLTWPRIGVFALLAAAATGVHAYHLPPVAAAFGASLVSELLQRRPGAAIRVLAGGASVALTVAACALLLGYNVGRGPSGGADALGVYGMNALAPLLPGGSQLFGQKWTGSWFTNVVDPSGAQGFEGMQYLGAGVLLLVLPAAVAALLGLVRVRPSGAAVLRWAPMWAAMIGLYVWAVGWNVYVGDVLAAQLPKPSGRVAELVGIFRGHGRFFWMGGYLLVALGVMWASRLNRAVGLPLLAIALGLQAWDMTPMRQGLRETFAETPPMYPAALADQAALRAREWVFWPTFHCSPSASDQRAIMELSLLAVRMDGALNTFPTARSVDPPCEAQPERIGDDARPGDPRVVVVTGADRFEGGPLQAVAWRSDCHRWARGVMCGQGLDGVLGLTPVARRELLASGKHEVLRLQLDQPPRPDALREGWWTLEPQGKGIWTSGPRAEARLDIPAAAVDDSSFILQLKAIGFSDAPLRPQRARVLIAGQDVGTLLVDPRDFAIYRLPIPKDVIRKGETLEIQFLLPDARSSEIDPRVLGIAVQSIVVLKSASSEPRATEEVGPTN